VDFEADPFYAVPIDYMKIQGMERRRSGAGIDLGLNLFYPEVRKSDPFTPSDDRQPGFFMIHHFGFTLIINFKSAFFYSLIPSDLKMSFIFSTARARRNIESGCKTFIHPYFK
jgi:hypothetical protein